MRGKLSLIAPRKAQQMYGFTCVPQRPQTMVVFDHDVRRLITLSVSDTRYTRRRRFCYSIAARGSRHDSRNALPTFAQHLSPRRVRWRATDRRLLAGERSWRELVERYGFEIALLPRDWPLSTALEREPGWRRVYEDRLAVLYERRRGGTGCDSTEDSFGC